MKIAIDIETTGFSKDKNDLIVLAAVEVLSDLTIGKRFSAYLRPEKKECWTRGAEGIHGISLTEALGFDRRRDGILNFMNWLKPHVNEFPLSFIYHGKNRWDFNFLKATFLKELLHESFERVFTIDKTESTVDLAKQYLKLPNYKLNTVCEALSIDLNHHEAMSDALACAQIYTRLNGQYGSHAPDLFNTEHNNA